MQIFRDQFCYPTWLVCLCLLLPVKALAQTNSSTSSTAQLPPAAQESIEKGLSAAKQQEWLAAVGHFGEARTAAPESPIPLYDLGLAEAQLPGRELRAICWFEAYLALAPNAVNAPAVHRKISDLEVRAEDNVGKNIELLKVLAAQSPTRDILPGIARLLIKNGDINAAEQFVQNQPDKSIQNHVREKIVETLAELKRIPDAIKQAEAITEDADEMDAYGAIFLAQIAVGSFFDAKISIEKARQNILDLIDNRLKLVEAEYQFGRRDGALLSGVRASIDAEADDVLRESHLAIYAVALYKIDRRKEADELFQQIKKHADGITGKGKNGRRMMMLDSLVFAKNEIGRRSEALGALREAEAAYVAAKNAHEEDWNRVASNELFLWGALDKQHDYDEAKASLRRFRSYSSQNRYGIEDAILIWEEELETWKALSIVAAIDASCKAAKASSSKMLVDTASTPAQRARTWSDYIEVCLSAPLFTTDMTSTMARLASFTPPVHSNQKSKDIFDHAQHSAEDLIDRINDVHELEHK